MTEYVLEILHGASIWVIPVVIAITFHEAAHGFVAWRLGDDTAKRLGRVTFNPISHVDKFGTIVLPGLLLLVRAPFLFGYAKPVPVDFSRLNNPRRDMILVAAAGPASNFVLAYLAALLLYGAALLPETAGVWVAQNLVNAVVINLVLAIFNLLPIPPLDGGRIAVGILPYPLAFRLAKLERAGLVIVIAVLFLIPFAAGQLGYRIDVLGWLVWQPVAYMVGAIEALAGLQRGTIVMLWTGL